MQQEVSATKRPSRTPGLHGSRRARSARRERETCLAPTRVADAPTTILPAVLGELKRRMWDLGRCDHTITKVARNVRTFATAYCRCISSNRALRSGTSFVLVTGQLHAIGMAAVEGQTSNLVKLYGSPVRGHSSLRAGHSLATTNSIMHALRWVRSLVLVAGCVLARNR
jgi:hypothetical protein